MRMLRIIGLCCGSLCVLLSGAGRAAGAASAGLGDLRLYECVSTQQAPVIDGKLDDACWQQASATTGFVRVLKDVGTPPSVQTHVQLLHDNDFLYVAVTCDEPRPQSMVAEVRENDVSAVCGDDCIELFFHPDPQSPKYYQLAANSLGARYDGMGFDSTWNGDWQAQASVGQNAWHLECRIALSSFPERRRVWRFNVCREFRSRPVLEYHVWSDTYGAFHSPSRFGHLVFSDRLSGLRRGYLIEAGVLARLSLEQQQALEAKLAEVASAGVRGTDAASVELRTLKHARDTLVGKYAGRRELSIGEWRELNEGLAQLNTRLDEVYWEFKFRALLDD